MIENMLLQFGALGIVGYVVYVQMNSTNKIMLGVKSAIEKNTYVIERLGRNDKGGKS